VACELDMLESTSSVMMLAVMSTGSHGTESWLGRFDGILPRYLELATSLIAKYRSVFSDRVVLVANKV